MNRYEPTSPAQGRTHLWLSLLLAGFTLASAYILHSELLALESSEEQTVPIPALLVASYQHLGRVPTVSLVVLFAFFIAGLGVRSWWQGRGQ